MDMFDFLSQTKVTQNINGIEVSVLLEFKNYKKEHFENDLMLLKAKNSDAMNVPGAVDEKIKAALETAKSEIRLNKDIYYQIKKGFQPIYSFDNYKELCTKLIAQYVFYIVSSDFKDIIAGKKEFTFKFKVIDLTKADFLAYYDPKYNTENSLTILMSGTFFAGRIYGPYIYSGKIDASIIEKNISHEFELYKASPLIAQELAIYKEIKKQLRSKKADENMIISRLNGSAAVIYASICNLYDMGLATLNESKYSQEVKFDLNSIGSHIGILIKISKCRTNKEAYDTYENEFAPNGRVGEPYLGRLMCYTIGLGILKRNRKSNPVIGIISPAKISISFSKLNDYLQSEKVASLEPLDVNTLNETFALLRGITHRQFLELYFTACADLGFNFPSAIIDRKIFQEILENASLDYKYFI
jgi:hypothetical protein